MAIPPSHAPSAIYEGRRIAAVATVGRDRVSLEVEAAMNHIVHRGTYWDAA